MRQITVKYQGGCGKCGQVLPVDTPARVKGDAERAKQIKREANDLKAVIGGVVFDGVFGDGIIEKINKKTYTIRFKSKVRDGDYITTRPKHFIKFKEG